MLDASGFKGTDEFFLDPDNLPPDLQQRIAAKLQMAQSQQNPAAEIEREKLQVERAKAEAELALDREKMVAELQLKREMQMEEMKMKFELRQQEMAYEAQLVG